MSPICCLRWRYVMFVLWFYPHGTWWIVWIVWDALWCRWTYLCASLSTMLYHYIGWWRTTSSSASDVMAGVSPVEGPSDWAPTAGVVEVALRLSSPIARKLNPRRWRSWQNYPGFHGHDSTDRVIPGSTAMTVLTEVSQVIRALCGVKSCPVAASVNTFTWPSHKCGLCVAPSRNPSCLHACITNDVSLCEWSLTSIGSILSKLWIGAFEGIVYINHVWIETAECPRVVGEMPWPSCPSLGLLYHVLSNLWKDACMYFS